MLQSNSCTGPLVQIAGLDSSQILEQCQIQNQAEKLPEPATHVGSTPCRTILGLYNFAFYAVGTIAGLPTCARVACVLLHGLASGGAASGTTFRRKLSKNAAEPTVLHPCSESDQCTYARHAIIKCIHSGWSLGQRLVRASLLGLAGGGLLCVASSEELLGGIHLGLDGGLAGLPVGGAHLAVFLDKLERLHQAQRLVHGAAHGQVVHGDLAQVALGVDDEQAAVRDALVAAILHLDAVCAGDVVGLVGQQGQVHGAKAALLAGALGPGQMGEVRVNAAE